MIEAINDPQSAVQPINWAPYTNIASYTISGTICGGPIGGLIGLTAGLIDNFVTNPPKSWAPYFSVALSTVGGTIIGGPVGGLIGLNTGLMDEFLITHQYTTKHYTSMIGYHSSVTFGPWATVLANVLPTSYKLPILALSYASSAVMTHYTNDFMDFYNKIEVPFESFLTINRLFNEKEASFEQETTKIYNQFIENPIDALVTIKENALGIYSNEFLSNFIATTAFTMGQVVVNKIFLYSLGSYSNSMFVTTLFTNHNSPFTNPLSILQFIAASTTVISSFILQNSITGYINTRLNNLSWEHDKMMIEKTNSLLLEKGNVRKVLSMDKAKGQQIIKSFEDDLDTLSDGAKKLQPVLTNAIESLIDLRNLLSFSPNILLPYTLLTLSLKQKNTNSNTVRLKEINAGLNRINTEAGNIISDITDKAEQISLRDGEEFMKYKFSAIYNFLKKLVLDSKEVARSTIDMNNMISYHDRAVDAIYFGTQIHLGKLKITEIPFIYSAMSVVSNFLSSNLGSEMNNIDIMQAKERVDTFFKWINTSVNSATRIHSENGEIVFKNYSLLIAGQELVHIDSLIFEPGKHYAITGESGCGKTSTITDLKSGVMGIFSSTGEIHLPKNAKIMLLDEQLFIPKGATLLEVIYFPKILDELTPDEVLALKTTLIPLLDELGISKLIPYLDTEEFRLSGGEMQKISIIQAIFYEPDYLIMDENFSRLDAESVIKVQQVIENRLKSTAVEGATAKKTTVIVIDHKVSLHNYNNFYYKDVHFENKIITVSEVAPTSKDALNEVKLNEDQFDEVSTMIQQIAEKIDEHRDLEKLQKLAKLLNKLLEQPTAIEEKVTYNGAEDFIYGQLYGICLIDEQL